MSQNKRAADQDAVEVNIDVNAFEEEHLRSQTEEGQTSADAVGATAKEAAEQNDKEDNISDSSQNNEPEALQVIEKLNQENAQLKEQLLRARAETENVRRRGEREKADAGAYAVTGFARDMLTVTDNLRRALDAMPENVAEDMNSFVEGVELTEREVLKAFERHGITKINPEPGEKFDHNYHQAMFEMESEEFPAGHVAQAVAPGYVIKDRLLRPAMVGTVKK